MRLPRKRCESDIYHVIVRGAGRQILFEDDAERQMFVEALAEKRAKAGVELYAWCLMSNHVYLILHAALDDISTMMRALETRYAGYFNFRHGRSGVLFRGRFTSVPVEDEAQLMQAIRYMHRNPVKVGIPMDNPWSGFGAYAGGYCGIDVDTGLALGIFGDRGEFFRFCSESGDDSHSGRIPRQRVPDQRALAIANYKGQLEHAFSLLVASICDIDDHALCALQALFERAAVHADGLGAQLHCRDLARVDEPVDRRERDLQVQLHRAHVEPHVRAVARHVQQLHALGVPWSCGQVYAGVICEGREPGGCSVDQIGIRHLAYALGRGYVGLHRHTSCHRVPFATSGRMRMHRFSDRGFTCCGEWRQVAENADSLLGFSMFNNHGTHTFDGAQGRMSGSAAERLGIVSTWNQAGGNDPVIRPGSTLLLRRGLGFRFPPLVPRSTANRATSRDNSPRIPPRDYLQNR